MNSSRRVSLGLIALGFGASVAHAQQPLPVQVSAGAAYTCARLTNGTVSCWGRNNAGQLGTGNMSSALSPAQVSGLTGVTSITTGDEHACALLSDGTARCWGFNADGELGDNTRVRKLTPVAVPGLNNAIGLAAGGTHTCALLAAGTVRCWGDNSDGQLGDGTLTDRLTPVAVSGVSNAIAIEAGFTHTCAVLSTGGVRCWGFNENGQVGNGTFNSPVSTPAAVSGITSANAIGLGWDHACVLISGSVARCWGYNATTGALGDGTTTDHNTPVAVINLTGAAQIAAGFDHTCALLSAGTVLCWGSNLDGEAGDGTLGGNKLAPVAVAGLDSVTGLALGQHHVCAVQAGIGTIRCWGSNANGERGNGTNDDTVAPTLVAGFGVAVPWGGFPFVIALSAALALIALASLRTGSPRHGG